MDCNTIIEFQFMFPFSQTAPKFKIKNISTFEFNLLLNEKLSSSNCLQNMKSNKTANFIRCHSLFNCLKCQAVHLTFYPPSYLFFVEILTNSTHV